MKSVLFTGQERILAKSSKLRENSIFGLISVIFNIVETEPDICDSDSHLTLSRQGLNRSVLTSHADNPASSVHSVLSLQQQIKNVSHLRIF